MSYYLYNGIFMAIGALDKCIGNKFGYGQKFEEGIMAMEHWLYLWSE